MRNSVRVTFMSTKMCKKTGVLERGNGNLLKYKEETYD